MKLARHLISSMVSHPNLNRKVGLGVEDFELAAFSLEAGVTK